MLNLILRKLQRFWSLKTTDKALLFLVYFLLGISRLVVLTVPFRFYARYLGDYKKVSINNIPLSEKHTRRAKELRWMINKLARMTPWNSNCLAQAMTASVLLKREKIPYALYFGLRRNPTLNIEAHAWVQAGTMNITGSMHQNNFKVVGTYTSYND